ncbi:MAG: hypothetical protein INQ03_14410 [Candidatus Heimdallarchaeota archaeon]|nr:hypothetical protein [Candidatus Heimdallarchaeota archaeon]
MSVLIKDIDKELYSKFKAEAALHGIKVGEALTLAMQTWLDQQHKNSQNDPDRTRNNATYRRLIFSLEKEHAGKWMIINKAQLVGVFANREEALKMAKNKNLEGHSIICPISSTQQTRTLGLRRRER